MLFVKIFRIIDFYKIITLKEDNYFIYLIINNDWFFILVYYLIIRLWKELFGLFY